MIESNFLIQFSYNYYIQLISNTINLKLECIFNDDFLFISWKKFIFVKLIFLISLFVFSQFI